ncbi:MAG: YdeI/OmpD-associated family protein [Bacteroidota bacterium]
MNPKTDWYFEKAGKWQSEISTLRTILLGSDLHEELKWGCPCYQLDKKNVVLIHTFKEYCALLFFKGALMKDRSGLLIQQTENVQSARQMRFTGLEEVLERQTIIREYILEAIEIEKAGLKVELKKTTDYAVPEEFQVCLNDLPELKTAFEALTPGRQRGYLFHFSQAKQAKTREARIEKYIPKILEGKGLED